MLCDTFSKKLTSRLTEYSDMLIFEHKRLIRKAIVVPAKE